MGSAQGKLVEVGSRKLQIRTQLKSGIKNGGTSSNTALMTLFTSGKSKSLYLVKDVNTGHNFVLKRTVVTKGLNDVLARAKWEAELYVREHVIITISILGH